MLNVGSKFVVSLEEAENEYAEIIYRINVRRQIKDLLRNDILICWKKSNYSWKSKAEILKNWMMKDG
jgi:hypothetical protein